MTIVYESSHTKPRDDLTLPENAYAKCIGILIETSPVSLGEFLHGNLAM